MKKTLISLLTFLFVTFTPITEATTEGEQYLPDSQVEQADTDSRLDLNNATQDQLESIIGIGEIKSKAIIAKRDELGRYENLEQLLQVSGIGPKTLNRISPYLSVISLQH